MAQHTDQEVVAAINSCLDLKKLQDLPSDVVDRFRELVKHHRVRAVCFFTQYGFGMRVYRDEVSVHSQFDDDMELTKGEPAKLDMAGYWVRCPGEMWNPEGNKEFIVTNKRGTSFVGQTALLTIKAWRDSQEDDDDQEDDDFTPTFDWRSVRNRAMVFRSKDKAEECARQCDGVVLEK